MLLSEARTRLLAATDDQIGTGVNGVKFTLAELDDALAVAQEEVHELIIGTGSGLFTQEASISSSAAGVLTLTTLKPLKIVRIDQVSGAARLAVHPSQYEALQNYAAVENFKILYDPRCAFPSSGSAAFVWGHANITSPKRFEALMIMLAASELKVKEGERNPALLDRIAALKETVENSVSPNNWSIIPLTGYPNGSISRFRYIQTSPDILQLLY